MIYKECTIQLDWTGFIKEPIFHVEQLSRWDMIIVEPAVSASNTPISVSKEPVSIQPPNMQQFSLTVWQTLKTQGSFSLAAITITCEKVIDYCEEDEDTIVISSSKVEEQFKPVKEFQDLLPKTIPIKLLPLGEVNHHNRS